MWRLSTLILPWMLTTRLALTRSLALLTPLCMIWVFAACVSLCAGHDELVAGGAEAHSTDASGFADTQDCCPAGEASCGVQAHRATSVSHTTAAGHAPEAAALPAAECNLARPAGGVHHGRSPDPPFERLRTLRI
jgi:hypothetical protein